MRLQIANPSAHPELAGLPFCERLEDWDLDGCTACSVSTATSCG